MELLFLCIGLVLLILGGEFALRGALGLARNLGVSPAIIGLTVLGFGTSAPELVVTVRAALTGSVDIAVGNAVGSNIANTFLILGIGALICPLVCDPKAVYRDTGFMVAASVLLCVLGYFGVIERWEGVAMVMALFIFICWSYFHDIRTHDAAADLHTDMADEKQDSPTKPLSIAIHLFAGICGLVYGASLLVDSAVTLAEAAGVPQSIIGLTLVAFGTSLPELGATAIAAIFHPLEIAPEISGIDQWIVLASAIILVPILITGWRINRMEGVVLLLLYIGYISSVIMRV